MADPKFPMPPPGFPAMPTPPGMPAAPFPGATQATPAQPASPDASRPFSAGAPVTDTDVICAGQAKGATIRAQEALATGSVLDSLCLTLDRSSALGGIPKGAVSALIGPSGKGKTRTALAILARVAQGGANVGLVTGEVPEAAPGSGREDLLSRAVRIGTAATGLDEASLRAGALSKLYIAPCLPHRGLSWDDIVARVRHLVERVGVRLLVVDNLAPLDPARASSAENLAALRSYLHERGVTGLVIGTLRDPSLLGTEGLHGADAVFVIEEIGLTSKEMAEQWGGRYRDKIDVIRAVKCSTNPIFPHLVRTTLDGPGVLRPHPAQPAEYALLP